MFHVSTRMRHVLSPDAYYAANHFSREMESIFSSSWHFVGVETQLANPGDFLTAEICGRPIQVRNFEDAIHAVSNVCAHRHCLLTSERRGHSAKMSCQYHGWEYNQHGSTGRIPQAQNFLPLDRMSTRIPTYRVENVGPLIFVNLDDRAPGLRASIGERYDLIERRFDGRWEAMMHREFPLSVNWKIPIENSLEAYHVPAVHSQTFREDPGEGRSEHSFDENGSFFRTTLPFAPHSPVDLWFQRLEGHFLKTFLGEQPTAQYEQHLVLPNCLFSFTDMLSLIHVVRPTGPRSCESVVCQFGRVGDSAISRRLSQYWGAQASRITLAILNEDFQLYPDIQRGLEASTNPGMLGRCEERIYQFQVWVQDQLRDDHSVIRLPTNNSGRRATEPQTPQGVTES